MIRAALLLWLAAVAGLYSWILLVVAVMRPRKCPMTMDQSAPPLPPAIIVTPPAAENWYMPWLRWGVLVALTLGLWIANGKQGPAPVIPAPPVMADAPK